MTDKQREEIARLIQKGYVSGHDMIDGEEIVWELKVKTKQPPK